MPYHRIVAKFGTNLLTAGTDHLDTEVMARLAKQAAHLHHQGREIVLVSSGAIAAGRQKLKKVPENKNAPFRQVLASAGQNLLMHTYEEIFSQHKITIAQALLTRTDISNRCGYLNARNTLLALMELGVICIVNENDVVATDEIQKMRFGDNDNLSAMVANLIDADLLVLLTDVSGLYTADPSSNPGAQLIHRVEKIDASVEKLAGKTSRIQGTGGMITKIQAAKLATSSGTNVVIASGEEPEILVKIDAGERSGTFFPAQGNKLESKKRWMLSGLSSRGCITADKGAILALKEQHKSLLPAGIIEVKGHFQRGDIVDVFDQQGNRCACGICNYRFRDIVRIRGAHSDQISKLLGHNYGNEVIHRNNMVVL